MKIDISCDRARTLIAAVPGEFDGYPSVERLEVALPLAGISPDRLAVGTALVFARWLSGPLELPSAISALTAQRITTFFGDRFVQAQPVRSASLPLPRGTRTMRVTTDPQPLLGDTAGTGAPELHLASLTTHGGPITAAATTIVPSNIHVLAASRDHDDPWAGTAFLGLSALTAEYFDISVLQYEGAVSGGGGLRTLLECVGLGLAT